MTDNLNTTSLRHKAKREAEKEAALSYPEGKQRKRLQEYLESVYYAQRMGWPCTINRAKGVE